MSAKITDTLLYTSALWVILKRLDAATAKGGCMEKLKWHREGTLVNDSVSSLPSLQPLFVSTTSSLGVGQPKSNTNHNTRANLPVFNSYVVSLRLRTDMKHGYVRRNPADPDEKLGHLEWVGLIMDAIETGDDGKADASLEQSTRGPVSFATREPEMTSLSCESVIEVIFDGKGHQRIERGYTFPELFEPEDL